MLDQNTDRMWYVIGAVIVGAALIFLMNNTFPTLFANVGETFEDKVEDARGVVTEIVPEQVDGATPVQRNLFSKSLWSTSEKHQQFGGRVPYIVMQLEPHTTYSLSTTIPMASFVGDATLFDYPVYNVFAWNTDVNASSNPIDLNGAAEGKPYTFETDASGVIRLGIRDYSNDGYSIDDAHHEVYLVKGAVPMNTKRGE